MSANNFILIRKWDKKWVCSHRDMGQGVELFWEGEKEFDTLEEAVKQANKFMNEYEVEYGLEILTK